MRLCEIEKFSNARNIQECVKYSKYFTFYYNNLAIETSL